MDRKIAVKENGRFNVGIFRGRDSKGNLLVRRLEDVGKPRKQTPTLTRLDEATTVYYWL